MPIYIFFFSIITFFYLKVKSSNFVRVFYFYLNLMYIRIMEYELKYDIKIGIDKLKFVAESDANKFRDDFDEVYNVFMVKLGDLMDEYGVKYVSSYLTDNYLENYRALTRKMLIEKYPDE